MATATRTTTDTQARSIELAKVKGHTVCSHAARIIGWTLDETTGALASAAWRISSAHSDAQYTVTYVAGGEVQCECQAAQHARSCWHAGLAQLMAAEIARIYSPAGRAACEREYRANMARGE